MGPRFLVFPFVLTLACGDGGDSGNTPRPVDNTEHVPDNAVACDHLDKWPYSVASGERPMLVHYREAADRAMAEEVVGHLEHAWRREVEEIGFRPPPSDAGACGPDDRLDVFLWRGHEDAYVDVLGGVPETSWADQRPYMVVDAWGPYAGALLRTTLAHEFNHACQAADDWFDTPAIFEMTAVFMEDVVVDGSDDYKSLLVDFQSRPDWSLGRNDDYETWYMYAASLFLFYLRDRFYDGDPSFAAEMWLRSRSSAGAEADPAKNEPDFEDALDAMLRERAGVGYYDAVVEFARYRWFTGSRDDGLHFAEGSTFPEDAKVASTRVSVPAARAFEVQPAPMMLGSAYLDVEAPAGTVDVGVEVVSSAKGVRWVVQAVPGRGHGADGEVIDVERGGRLRLDAKGKRTLVLTALPVGADDPDDRSDQRFPVAVRFLP
jgi:hypothetical protein